MSRETREILAMQVTKCIYCNIPLISTTQLTLYYSPGNPKQFELQGDDTSLGGLQNCSQSSQCNFFNYTSRNKQLQPCSQLSAMIVDRRSVVRAVTGHQLFLFELRGLALVSLPNTHFCTFPGGGQKQSNVAPVKCLKLKQICDIIV